jgi:hypothetical protein
VRLGIGTEENGVMLEYQYPDDSDALLYFGCCDVTSEGGSSEVQVLGTVTALKHVTTDANDSSQDADMHAVLTFRVPEQKTMNGTSGPYSAYNTRDVHIKDIDFKANDEGTFYLFRTRDPSNIVAAQWGTNWSGDVEYAVGDTSAPNTITEFLPNNMDRMFVWGVEADQGRHIDMHLEAPVLATSGDYYLLAFKSSQGVVSGDEVEASFSLGVEK